MNFLTNFIIPPWAKWFAIALAALALYGLGRFDGTRIAGNEHLEYVAKQANQTVRITRALQQVVVKTEIKFRDRINTIYVKGDVILKEVPKYVTAVDNAGCTVNAGFVRVFDAAWSGEPPGPAVDSDRGPSGIPLSVVAETDAHNAKSCLAWREQALGWREFYKNSRVVIDKPLGEN